jgi:pyroglutamyl-peptidase
MSRDAGDYLCNYLCWHAARATKNRGGPAIAAFIHVPDNIGATDLARAGRAFLNVVASRLSRNPR